MPPGAPAAAVALVLCVLAGLILSIKSTTTRRALLFLAAIAIALILFVYLLNGKVDGR